MRQVQQPTPLQAKMQENPDAAYGGFSVNKPSTAAKLLRNDWDDTILYKFKIGVLMLNEYLQPLGTAYEYIYNGDIVNMRKLCSTLAKTEPAFIYISINSPVAVYKDLLTLEEHNASLLYKFALAITNLDIDVMGYLLVDPFDHIFFQDDVAMLGHKG